MSAITKLYLCSVPLEKDYTHTLYFANATAQYNYFYGQRKKSAENFSYQRKDNIIRFPADMDEILAAGCNYVMYQNTAYSSKWFYAFITDMQYINDERTDIKIETDCIQTWLFDYTLMPSFVEREHCIVDDVLEEQVDEGLEIGEYVCDGHLKSSFASGHTTDDLSIVIGVTQDPSSNNVNGVLYNNIYSGIRYYQFPASDYAAVNEFIAQYDGSPSADAIVCMFMAPRRLTGEQSDHSIVSGNTPTRMYINGESGVASDTNEILYLLPSTFEMYEPRNKKLLTYPYTYLLVSNNNGGSAIFKFEQFFTGVTDSKTQIQPRFLIEGSLCPGCSIRLIPLQYHSVARYDEGGLNMGKFPILNWTSDVYTNWLTQNGVNIALDIAAGAGQIVGGAALAVGSGGIGTAVGGGGIVSGFSQIAGTLAQVYQQSFTPPQASGNTNCGDAVTAAGQNDFHFYRMTITRAHAQIIDDYFDMYGYKTNLVKIPYKAHRENWWFTKTIDVNIKGAIPQADLQVIKDCYNRGITFWRTPANIKNYSLSNSIV